MSIVSSGGLALASPCQRNLAYFRRMMEMCKYAWVIWYQILDVGGDVERAIGGQQDE